MVTDDAETTMCSRVGGLMGGGGSIMDFGKELNKSIKGSNLGRIEVTRGYRVPL